MDLKLAKKNAIKIRAAFKQGFQTNSKQLASEFAKEFAKEDSDKTVTPKDRKAAVRFVQTKIKVDKKSLDAAFTTTYADAVVLGRDIAGTTMGTEVVANWDKWKAGNRAASALLKPEGALKQMLKEKNILVSKVWRTKIDRVGSILADGLDRGLGVDALARLINDEIGDARHALAIAWTETARAQTIASRMAYQDAGIEMFEWITADPCPLCEDIEEESKGGVPFGYVFTQGDGITEPPAHPECRCDIIPVVDSAFKPDNENR